MRNTRLFLTQLPAKAREAALVAAREAFPLAEVVEVATAEEATRITEADYLELLVLNTSESSALSQATHAANKNGLPRWAVVNFGRLASDICETVSPEDLDSRWLARVFRFALLQHELRCENHRLRGDLKTVARRFNHDLTTPVACISTSSDVLKILPANDARSIAAIIQNIDDSAAEISLLAEHVCFVLRASAYPFTSVNVEMSEVLATVLNELETDIQQTKATVSLPPSWPMVTGVEKWLEVIWTNFLRNALQHGGPAVKIRAAWKPDGEEYRFCAYDNGTGIAPTIQAALFPPFEQLHTLHTRGLGLSIVQRLTVLQGGRCGYERTAENENCFYFTLPTSPPLCPSKSG